MSSESSAVTAAPESHACAAIFVVDIPSCELSQLPPPSHWIADFLAADEDDEDRAIAG
jgi:hypothetical protein